MPEKHIGPMIRNLRIGDLAELKRYWLTSMSSIVRSAKELGFITNDRYMYFNIELSRGGRSDDRLSVFIDEPNLFTEAYNIHKKSLGYSKEELATAFNLPVDIVQTPPAHPPGTRCLPADTPAPQHPRNSRRSFRKAGSPCLDSTLASNPTT